MRLINTATFQFVEFGAKHVPPYAILSHTWGSEEIRYEDWLDACDARHPSDDARAKEISEKAGYRKIRSFCEIARERGLQYAWADTCCIDQKNSPELSEAINSMALWYGQADVCIVYLADVPSSAGDAVDSDIFQRLEESRWFTRGWTLQELLKPRRLLFYSASWERIGSLDKDDALLIGQAHAAPLNLSPPMRGFYSSLERASHIKIDDLCIAEQFQSASVAQRMFWASHRQTTKAEDMGYSLLSLFSVNMPLIYAEGGKSFQRLQETVMRSSFDESIFAWTYPPFRHPEQHRPRTDCLGSVFAVSPADFANSNDIERTPVNLDRALVLNGNGIDIYRNSNSFCVFRRQRGQRDEQLLFLIQLGAERNIPGQLSDPCIIALLAEVRRRGDSESQADIDEIVQHPITIDRRVMGHSLNASGKSKLADLGFEQVEAVHQRRCQFWLPFENVAPGRERAWRVGRRASGSRL